MPCARVRVREHAPDRELEVGHRIGHDGRAPLGSELELRLLHPHAVREEEPRREHAETVEVRTGALARAVDATRHLVVRLEEVEVHGYAACCRLLGDPRQRRFARGVDAVRRERGLHPRRVLGELVEVTRRLVARGFAARGIHAVEEGWSDRGVQARVADGACDRGRSPVHVPEADGAGADHLEAGEACPPVHVVVGEAGFGRPDLLFEPLHERQVAAEAAEQGHRCVGMPVHEPREEHVAVRVEDVVAGLRADVGPELGDRSVDGAEAGVGAVERGGVAHRERSAHASSGITRSSAANNAAWLACLPASNSSQVRC